MTHHHFMKIALLEAQKAYDEGEVPIGALVVANGQIIGKGYNQTEKLHDSTAHAEMIAITSAFSSLNNKYLKNCTLYVTLEPCAMCAGASKWAQIAQIVYGCRDEKGGYANYTPSILHPKTEIISGIEEEACREIVQKFFRERRK
ncbi:MAG: nucleoside deaminase [Bacteroidetes bacterium]|nr:nucleoside deaminase [Bacteroidota bacterium]